jgi:hypothetical protein
MFEPREKTISMIVGKLSPRHDEPDGDEGPDDGLIVAAGDVLTALGQDYGTDTPSGRMAYEDKCHHLAEALHRFFVIADSMPHREGEHGDGYARGGNV